MKLLVVLLVILFGVWLWRSRRLAERQSEAPPKALQNMVTCAVCGVHLPQSEALTGARGLYCSAAHRQQAER